MNLAALAAVISNPRQLPSLEGGSPLECSECRPSTDAQRAKSRCSHRENPLSPVENGESFLRRADAPMVCYGGRNTSVRGVVRRYHSASGKKSGRKRNEWHSHSRRQRNERAGRSRADEGFPRDEMRPATHAIRRCATPKDATRASCAECNRCDTEPSGETSRCGDRQHTMTNRYAQPATGPRPCAFRSRVRRTPVMLCAPTSASARSRWTRFPREAVLPRKRPRYHSPIGLPGGTVIFTFFSAGL